MRSEPKFSGFLPAQKSNHFCSHAYVFLYNQPHALPTFIQSFTHKPVYEICKLAANLEAKDVVDQTKNCGMYELARLLFYAK